MVVNDLFSIYNNLSDAALMKRIKQKDKRAFDTVFIRHNDSLFLFAVKILKNRDDASDIVQDVFVKLWTNSVKIPDDICLKSYLFSTVRNKILNYLRDKNKRLINNYKILEMTDEMDYNEAFKSLIERNRLSQVEKIIEDLPKQQKAVIGYRLQGLSNKDIANTMKLSINTVNIHYRMAMNTLKNIISEDK